MGKVITIAREFGSGGRIIAQKVAEKLGIVYYDNEIIDLAAKEMGFDVDVIGIKRIESASLRWRAAYKDKGVLGLEDTRTLNSGRTLNRELTIEEIIAKKDAEIEYLKAELELIKKLELQERQVINKKIPASKIFRLIQNLIQSFNLKNMTRHLCKIANVSTSGYYNFLNIVNELNNKGMKIIK